MNAVFHPVTIYADDRGIELNCPTLELSESERAAYIAFWMDGVK